MKMNYKNVDKIVERQQSRGIDVRWQGWDLIYFTPDNRALYSKDGHRRVIKGKSVWGYETKLIPNEHGNWIKVE